MWIILHYKMHAVLFEDDDSWKAVRENQSVNGLVLSASLWVSHVWDNRFLTQACVWYKGGYKDHREDSAWWWELEASRSGNSSDEVAPPSKHHSSLSGLSTRCSSLCMQLTAFPIYPSLQNFWQLLPHDFLWVRYPKFCQAYSLKELIDFVYR